MRVLQLNRACAALGLSSDMLGGMDGRKFVELSDDDAQRPAAACSPMHFAKSCFVNIQRRRPVFLVIVEALLPKVFYGWVVVLACGIGWWCVAPAATFGVGVFVDYWLTDPGAGRAHVLARQSIHLLL